MAYKIINNTLSILLLLFFAATCSQAEKICGKVVNAKDGQPIAGVTVKIQNSGFVATTDSHGNYCLDYAPGKFRVVFQKVGFYPWAVDLNIAQKTQYPLERVDLQPVPRLVDMYGQPLSGAKLYLKRGFDNPQPTDQVTDSFGNYIFDFMEGDIQILFEKTGFRTDGFYCNLTRSKYPAEETFVLCPDEFGVYVNGKYISGVQVSHHKAPMERYGGGLNIPRIKGHWEGTYYLSESVVEIPSSGKSLTFYVFPEISGRLGPGGDPFEPGRLLLY